ncbi:hypothetical protein NLJ89_g8036 [Agrocybe chaxingu]|uniref:PPM-type phosphatase domain-containing protein n=1 Tax=Agrocybe chaxingu TaxID=84603 RepID=A0A9W8K2I1_9AGAR|nr:hypothetical protein NLJ89_g8036 [Agrocybe chaxingu]
MSYVKKTTDMGWPQQDALWIYRVLPEPKLSAELQQQSRASSVRDTDALSFQPCPNPDHYNQDRARILDWPLPGGTWFFRGVFDGHAGHETVDYTVSNLPKIIKAELAAILEKNTQPEPSVISDALTRAISSFDESIGKAVLDLFPDQAALSHMSDAEIRQIVNDKGPNSATVLRCVRGSTVLISLTDPSKSNVWVASLGDCAAVLGTREGGEWKTRVLSTAHNGENAVEVERIRSEHPGEAECILDDRVLGAIAVTRAVGDFSFKLPAIYTSRVFLNSHPGFVIPEKVRIFTRRNLTPPYMSGVPDIKHVHLPSLNSDAAFLIMCTDGMMDLDEENRLKLEQVLSKRWVNYVGSNFDQKKNLALGLLREALGGDDIEKVSRVHYRSDHHRYNMKRRVASLPPISVEVFNQKVLERRTETAIMSSAKGSSCEVCNKVYTTENAYRSHIQSKKHKENETKAALKAQPAPTNEAAEEKETPVTTATSTAPAVQPTPAPAPSTSLLVDENATEEEITQTIEEKIAASRARLCPTSCLFCSQQYPTLDENLTHMSTSHSFFIPDAEYLIDLPGLISYLGEKIVVGNVCIFCNERGREFRSLDAVRKHMIDKSHCKISFETESDRLEISDFYDFTSSYPDAGSAQSKKKAAPASSDDDDEEWEDAEDVGDGEIDEIVDESESDETSSDEDDLPGGQITYGDTNYELVLPSGARIGHRSMRRYYAQSFPGAPRGGKPEDSNSGAALVRRLLADKNSCLVPRKGGFGAYGGGTDVVKARNRGEAREAGRHVREFRDQKRREAFKTKVGFIHNSQKHFRDPLLQ